MGPKREPNSDNLGEQLSPLFSTKKRLKKARIIAILRGQNPTLMFERGIALANMGCSAIEVTLDSKEPLQILQKLRTSLPDSVLLGVGTVLDREQIEDCAKAGATFALSPVFPDGMIEDCRVNNMLAIPGVSNISELKIAQKSGAEIVKLFPSTEWSLEQLDGIDIPWMPVGGVDHDSIWSWLESGAWCVGMGTNLCGSDLSLEANDVKHWAEDEAQRARDIFMELQRRQMVT